LSRAVREWPLWIAVAGILSLLFIPFLARVGTPSRSAEQRELDELRRDVESGNPALAESRLVELLARRPPSAVAADLQLLLARATLARARNGDFPGAAGFQRAWLIFSGSPRSPETLALRRETASLMAEYGLVRDAVERMRQLAEETQNRELALDLVPALVALAGETPALRHALLDEASAKISEFRPAAPPERRVKGILAQARIYRESKRDEDLLQLLGTELAETKAPADRGWLQMERGRALARLGREMEAMVCFDEAEKLLVDPLDRGLAMVHQAQLYARASNPECVEVSNRLAAADSPAAPLGLLVAGVYELKSRPSAALDALRTGFSRVRRPRLLDEIDFPWVYDAVHAAALRETDPERLLGFSAVFAEIGRLRPLSTRVSLDRAALLRRVRKYEEAANLLTSIEPSERTLLEAAEACQEGGLHLRAASLFRAYYDLQPAANAVGLYRRALSLKNAGDVDGAKAGFEEYLAKGGPTGTFAGAALLEKAELQRDEEAIATYDRILKAREVTTSPVQPDWANALLAKGRALVRLGRTADARKVLEEYLERYATAPGSISAASQLVATAVQELDWKQALERVRGVAAIAARVPEAERAPFAEDLRDLKYREAEILFQLEDYAASYRAYAEAEQRASGVEERLRAVLGRGRALARLARMDEAKRDYSSAKAMMDRQSFVGAQRDYWDLALDLLGKELR
jgi:tetratricopeptide (TPR) repeat protein